MSEKDFAFGFKPEDFATDTPEPYPDNVLPFEFFLYVKTQWRTNGNVVVGLDYNVFPIIFEILGIETAEEKREIIGCVQIMESAAISEMMESD